MVCGPPGVKRSSGDNTFSHLETQSCAHIEIRWDTPTLLKYYSEQKLNKK